MPDTLLTLADLVKINDVSVRDMGATDIFNDAPVLNELNAITASHGTDHKFVRESGAPVVGFRTPGTGRDWSRSQDTVVTVALAILDASFGIEAALADSNPRGRDYVMAREAKRHLRAALAAAERQVFYGLGASATGFSGLADSLNALSNAMVVSAGGATAANALTDVWMIRSTSDETALNAVVGNSGELKVSAPYEQMLDGSNGAKRNMIVQPIEGWMTLAMESTRSVGRLCNINDAANKLTDALLSTLFERFDETAPPTHIVMNRRSRRQLQASRTATSPSGAPAPWPEEWNGIPIISTKSVGVYTTAIA